MIKNKLYVLGSINLDFVASSDRIPKKGETILGTDFEIFHGGKGANQAIAASRMHVPVEFIGAVGEDFFGEMALRNLETHGIDVEHVQKISGVRTGSAVILNVKGNNRIIIHTGANKKIEMPHLKSSLSEIKEGDFFLSQFETEENLVKEGLKIAKKKGATTILNPAPARRIDNEMYQMIDYLIVNETELEYLSGIAAKKENASEIKSFFNAKGVDKIVVTLGEEGSMLLADEEIFMKSFPVEVVDSTGAGDSFIGVFVSELMKNKQRSEALKTANFAGAQACRAVGAQSSFISIKDLKKGD